MNDINQEAKDAIEQILNEDTGEVSELQIETLAGDLRDAMLSRIRDIKRPWSMLVEDEQMDLANGIELAAREFTRAALRLLTKWDYPHVVVSLGEIKIVGGDKARIEGKVGCPNIEDYRNIMGEHAGQHVVLVAVDTETFLGERAPAQIDPDQPELPADGEQGSRPDGE